MKCPDAAELAACLEIAARHISLVQHRHHQGRDVPDLPRADSQRIAMALIGWKEAPTPPVGSPLIPHCMTPGCGHLIGMHQSDEDPSPGECLMFKCRCERWLPGPIEPPNTEPGRPSPESPFGTPAERGVFGWPPKP